MYHRSNLGEFSCNNKAQSNSQTRIITFKTLQTCDLNSVYFKLQVGQQASKLKLKSYSQTKQISTNYPQPQFSPEGLAVDDRFILTPSFYFMQRWSNFLLPSRRISLANCGPIPVVENENNSNFLSAVLWKKLWRWLQEVQTAKMCDKDELEQGRGGKRGVGKMLQEGDTRHRFRAGRKMHPWIIISSL